jgi:hypothetical protein
MTLLDMIKELHDGWDSKSGNSGNDSYEDALNYCINELNDLIHEYEKDNDKQF